MVDSDPTAQREMIDTTTAPGPSPSSIERITHPTSQSVAGTESASPARERLISLDVFRGMTVAGMLLVNNPGSWGAIYPPLRHATWHGWTPTDLIFPFFLFIVGITTHISLGARRQRGAETSDLVRGILRRGGLIVLFGLLLAGFPYFTWGTVAGVDDPTFLQRVGDRLLHWRIPGVLQRIGVVYIVAALITLRTSLRTQVGVTTGLLLVYWIAMTALPVPAIGLMGQLVLDRPELTLAAWVDRALLDWGRLGNHLYGATKTWDPEGVLSTMPAVGTALLGVFAGRWISHGERPLSDRLNGLFAAGAIAMMIGLMWHWVFPINKGLWTSSYVLFTGGMACVALATCMWIIEERGVRGWIRPFVVFGVNPFVAFVGSGLMARMIYSIIKVPYDGRSTSLQSAIHQSMFLSWLSPMNASLLFALSFVLLWYVILSALSRRNIILKV